MILKLKLCRLLIQSVPQNFILGQTWNETVSLRATEGIITFKAYVFHVLGLWLRVMNTCPLVAESWKQTILIWFLVAIAIVPVFEDDNTYCKITVHVECDQKS